MPATRIDRLARSTFDLFAIVKHIVDTAQFRSLAEPWDTGTSTGRPMSPLLGGLADMERLEKSRAVWDDSCFPSSRGSRAAPLAACPRVPRSPLVPLFSGDYAIRTCVCPIPRSRIRTEVRERRAGGAGNARQGRGGGQQPCSQEVPISTSSSLPVHDGAAIRNVITRSIKTMDRATVSCPHFPRPGERPSRRVEPLGLVLRVGD